MDPLAAATREINPNAHDISNQQSAGALLDQPVGLAYISSGPLFERNGPIRWEPWLSDAYIVSIGGNRETLNPNSTPFEGNARQGRWKSD